MSNKLIGTRVEPVALMLCLALAPAAANADVVLDFSTSAQYNDNFTEYRAPSNIGWTGSHGGYISATTSSTNPNLRYNGANDILTESISVDYWLDSFPGNPSFFGIATRMANTTGVLGLIRFTSSTTIDLRLQYGANLADGGLGTAFFNATFDLATGGITYTTGDSGASGSTNTVQSSNWSSDTTWSSINAMTLLLDQTAGDDPSFRLTLSDAQGLIASTGFQVLTATDAYNQAGHVGTRLSSSGATIRHGIDNFTIVPEPAMAALLGAGAMMMVGRPRRS